MSAWKCVQVPGGAEDLAAVGPGAEWQLPGSHTLGCLAAMATLGCCCSPGPALGSVLSPLKKKP